MAHRESLEDQFREVWVERRNLTFVLPHQDTSFHAERCAEPARGVLFRSGARGFGFALQEWGVRRGSGRISVYEPRGIAIVTPSNRRGSAPCSWPAFEQPRDRLSHEGLFDEARKRPPAGIPRTVGG